MKFSLATILAFTAATVISAQESGDSLTTDNSTQTELVDPDVTPNLNTTEPVGEDGDLQTIPEVAIANADFNTLVALLSQADLVDTLGGDGPFTVFAPTDAAFDTLDKSEAKLLPCLKLSMFSDQLTALLTYHVASGEVMSTDLSDGQKIPMLQGEDVSVTIIGKDIFLNSAAVDDGTQVEAGDVMASNGIIHVINGVLVPPTFDVKVFLEQCRETNPDLDPVVGGEEDKALQEDTASDGKDLGAVTNGDKDKEAEAAAPEESVGVENPIADAEKEDDSSANLISTMGSIVAAALVTVFGM